VVALLLAACARSPYAAVPVAVSDVAQSALVGTAACHETAAARSALQNISQELQAQGMAMKATCQADGGGWVVQIRVMDGVKANQFVRGPLADGHDVDMGTPAGVPLAGASTASKGFSPDVQHNRQWLHALMARHQFDNVPDAWWHFAQRGAASGGTQTDLAAR
jgi:D-alanyl-D-alanine dipeptidase